MTVRELVRTHPFLPCYFTEVVNGRFTVPEPFRHEFCQCPYGTARCHVLGCGLLPSEHAYVFFPSDIVFMAAAPGLLGVVHATTRSSVIVCWANGQQGVLLVSPLAPGVGDLRLLKHIGPFV